MTLFLIIVMAMCIIALGVIFYIVQRNKKQGQSMRLVKEQKTHMYLFVAKKFFLSVPVLRRYYERVRHKTETLYPADSMSVSLKATQTMLHASIISGGCAAVILLISGGDLYYVCAGLFMTAILFRTLTEGRIEKLEKKILLQFNDFLSELPSYYRESNGIMEDAIYTMIDRLPYEIAVHISRIYDILIDPHMDERVEEYIASAPNKYILTFVSICSTTKEYGDKDLPDGSTAFLDGIINLRKEINVEVLRRINVDMRFQSLTVIAVAPIASIKFIEWWGSTMFEGISNFYTGTYGTLIVTLTFLSSYIAYTLILSLKNTKTAGIKEDSIWRKAAEVPVISAFLNEYVSKNYTKMVRLDERLRITGDHTGPKAFLVKRAVCAAAAFAMVIALFTAAGIQNKMSITKNLSEDFSNTIVPNESYTQAMEEMAEWEILQYKGKLPDREAVKEEMWSLDNTLKNETYIDQVTDVVMQRLEAYKGYYFKWYYILIATATALAGYMAPLLLLQFRATAVNISQEDEVNQFNTLMLIFMNMDGISIDVILEWLERFAYCFKQEISECIIEYEMGQGKALAKMRDEAKFQPFSKFVSCLLNADEVGIREAFDDIRVQQAYYNDKRQLDNDRMTANKARTAATIAFLPMMVVIVGYLIVPIGALGVKMSSGLTDTLNAI